MKPVTPLTVCGAFLKKRLVVASESVQLLTEFSWNTGRGRQRKSYGVRRGERPSIEAKVVISEAEKCSRMTVGRKK